MRFRLAVVACAWLAAASTASAQAEDVEGQIAELREQIVQARFSEAVSTARALLDRADVAAAQRNATLELLAIAQIANRQSAEAEGTLRLLYSRDPGHRLTDPDASPPVLSAFARAREARPAPVDVRFEHTPPVLTVREAPELTVRLVEGGDAVSEVRLVYRASSSESARVVMTPRPDGSYAARIPVVGDASAATDVAYYVVALAPSLTPLGQLGSPAEPLALHIPAEARHAPQIVTAAPTPAPAPSAPPSRSVAEEWWFWTILGVLVVGGAVTAGILLGPAQEGPEAGSLGTVRLMSVALP